ncbi:hypothetical protein BC940DRAFT_290654 [Gongronella butleri]|nr:hypothetical protein BC940DRAFT_290654 [Gongronella butleri]
MRPWHIIVFLLLTSRLLVEAQGVFPPVPSDNGDGENGTTRPWRLATTSTDTGTDTPTDSPTETPTPTPTPTGNEENKEVCLLLGTKWQEMLFLDGGDTTTTGDSTTTSTDTPTDSATDTPSPSSSVTDTPTSTFTDTASQLPSSMPPDSTSTSTEVLTSIVDASSSSVATSTATNGATTAPNSTASPGVIAGAVVGSIAGAAVLGFALFMFLRRRKDRRSGDIEEFNPEASSDYDFPRESDAFSATSSVPASYSFTRSPPVPVHGVPPTPPVHRFDEKTAVQ